MGLRVPKFILDGSSSSASSSNKLANYTRQQCHKRVSNNAQLNLDEDHDDDGDDNGAGRVTSDQIMSINNGAGGKNNNNDTTTNMEQCIISLEPSLKIFQSNCIQNDKA